MKLVVRTEPGVLELNYSWLPTWLGINNALKNELEGVLNDKMKGQPMDEAHMEEAHQAVIDFLCEKNPGVKGLFEYLDALKYVYLE